jgi:hypothetical protein
MFKINTNYEQIYYGLWTNKTMHMTSMDTKCFATITSMKKTTLLQ